MVLWLEFCSLLKSIGVPSPQRNVASLRHPRTGGISGQVTTVVVDRQTLWTAAATAIRGPSLTSYTPDGSLVVPPTPIVGTVKGIRVTVDSTEDEAGITDP
jgi:hypothetical protein